MEAGTASLGAVRNTRLTVAEGNKKYDKNNMTEEQRQKAKEEAVLLALKNDMALIRRDLEIFGMKKDGSTKFVSKSVDYDLLWEDALQALKKKFL